MTTGVPNRHCVPINKAVAHVLMLLAPFSRDTCHSACVRVIAAKQEALSLQLHLIVAYVIPSVTVWSGLTNAVQVPSDTDNKLMRCSHAPCSVTRSPGKRARTRRCGTVTSSART